MGRIGHWCAGFAVVFTAQGLLDARWRQSAGLCLQCIVTSEAVLCMDCSVFADSLRRDGMHANTVFALL
jgi:hypothetical protein